MSLGAYLDSHLSEFGEALERAARAALERFCAICGQPASISFGCFTDRDGTWVCEDLDCRAEAEARAVDAVKAPAAPVADPLAGTLFDPLMAAE
ncbi:hypothetical protein [Methylobacterium nigriterrae]|uniref:hypothetical protein n=1 Tax=Methylobacterium nigriterrae TaxID=3127512 RepID=UPI003013B6CD